MQSRASLLLGRARRRFHARHRAQALAAMANDPEPVCRQLAGALGAAAPPDSAAAIEALRAASAQIDAPEWAVHELAGRQRLDAKRAAHVGSKAARWGAVLHHIVAAVAPRRAIEFGTLIGISTAYQASAMAPGCMLSIERNGRALDVARRNLEALNIDVDLRLGTFDDVLDDVPADARFQYAFKDGHHTEEATVGIFLRLLPHLDSGAVFVFDDIRWSWGMRRAWRTIRKHPDVACTIDLFSMGIVIVRPGGAGTRHRFAVPGT